MGLAACLSGLKKMDNNGELEFLRAEAQTGLTFSKIALQSRHQEKTDRNRANARKAYDCLLHFMPRVTPTTGEWDEIRASVAELKSNLLGNFGDGTINTFDPSTGNFLGKLTDSAGKVIVNPGLWSLVFRNDGVGSPDTLYFTAGASGENHGLFGAISPVN